MKKLKHSLADWDFNTDTQLNISSDHFVSYPTSLKAGGVGYTPKWNYVFLKSTLAPNVKDGRIIYYHYPTDTFTLTGPPFFRAQALPPETRPDNCYYILLNNASVNIYKRTAGVSVLKATGAHTQALDYYTWTQWRVTWWEFIGPELQPILRIIIDRQIAGEWVQQLLWDDTDPSWGDSAVNLVGFCPYSRNTDTTEWMDDTEVWEKA